MRTLAVLFLTLTLAAGVVACTDTSKDNGAASTPNATVEATSTPPTCTPDAVPTGEAAGTAVPTVEGEPTVQDDCLVIYDIVVATGTEAKAGDTVTANYTGWLEDGTMFGTSIGGTAPQFSLASGQPNSVIVGWQEGVAGMKVGGTRRLVIPANLAYGAQGKGSVPPNATLTFDIELVSIP